jgi:hypothetical protein
MTCDCQRLIPGANGSELKCDSFDPDKFLDDNRKYLMGLSRNELTNLLNCDQKANKK